MKIKNYDGFINEGKEIEMPIEINEEFYFKRMPDKFWIEWVPVNEEEGVSLSGGFYCLKAQTVEGTFYCKMTKEGE